jgi:hypothetical protein
MADMRLALNQSLPLGDSRFPTPKSHRPSENDAKLGHAGDHAALAKALLMEDNNNWIYWLTRLEEKAQQDNGPALSLRFGKLVSVVA